MKLINYPVIRDRKLRIGLIGCGRIARNHFGSIRQFLDDLELVAVCDIDNEALRRASDEHNVP